MSKQTNLETGSNRLQAGGIADVEQAIPVEEPSSEAKVRARRKLIRQGASIVAVSLASRPVLAWHCKPVSIVGSEALYANTAISFSHRQRLDKIFLDETWGLREWSGNLVRVPQKNTSPDEWWEQVRPWRKLKAQTGITKNASVITIADLPNVTAPLGMNLTTPIVTLLGGTSSLTWQKRVLVAQLNYVALNGIPDSTIKTNFGYKNDMDRCITMGQLNDMASGTFYPREGDQSLVWKGAEIQQYLFDNWMARD